ncbi:hypothetical protein H0E87_008512 [Populus deltoides]|uniref:Uncharacterized protein n=1 Tax=Populus deltoides TaxID=3696 RepID=A0A8T2Z135_POPDE|nr:hypothetical protein H0E87_008512 [Populus deltoides]
MNKFTRGPRCLQLLRSSTERKNTFHQTTIEALTGTIKGHDVHLITEAVTDPNWDDNCAFYYHRTRELIILPYNATFPVSLIILEHDIFTITPIKVLAPGFSFAPLGLTNMFNEGGTIEGLKFEVKGGAELSKLDDRYMGESRGVTKERVGNYSDELVMKGCIEVKGYGKFAAYLSVKLRKCIVDSNMVDFVYDLNSGLVGFSLDSLPKKGKLYVVEIES